jgi:L-alanine-DL-glutamate epimerase-like enolase superfamily enzyme
VPKYAPRDLETSYATIRNAGIRLAGGEFEYGISGFRDVLDAGVLGCVMPDVKHCGGLRTAMTVDALAAERGVTVAPHNPGGPVATLASLHVCAAATAFEVLEYQWREVDEPERLLLPFEPRIGGKLSCPDRPGFGSSLNDDAVLEYAIPLD